MKILIWFCCALLYGIIITAFSFADISLGGIPSALIGAGLIAVAVALCKKVPIRTRPAFTLNHIKAFIQHNIASVPVTVVLLVILLICFFQILNYRHKIEDLEYQTQELTAQCDDEYDRGYSDGEFAVGSEALNSGYDTGYQDGLDDGYAKGYVIGYSSAVVDYSDAAVQSEINKKMLELAKQPDFYIVSYKWLIERRQILFGRGD